MTIVGIKFGNTSYVMLPSLTTKGAMVDNDKFLKTKELIKNRIKYIIQNNKGADFDLLVTDDNIKFSNRKVVKSSNIIGQIFNIIDDNCSVVFSDDDGLIIGEITDLDLNTLMPQKSLDQFMDIKKISDKTDIGNRVKMKGANLVKDEPIDSKVETYEKFEKRKKKFVPGWNLKNIKPIDI